MENELKNEPHPETEGSEEGNITVRRNKTADFIAKIVCLVLAFFLWYYASSIDTVIYDEEFASIPIEIENNSSYALLSGDGITVDVTLSGKRNVLRKVNVSDIKASVTIPEDASAGRHELQIHFDVPSGLNFEKASAGSVVVYVDNSVSKPVSVRVNLVSFNYETDCELKIGSVADVVVTGPAKLVESIEYAELAVDMGNQLMSKSISYRGELVLRNADGELANSSYIRLSSTTATVTISVLREKNVPIVVRFKNGLIGAEDCRITLSRSTLRVKGDAETVKDMVIECIIDEKTLKDNVTVSRGISLPSGVTNLDSVYNVDVTVDLTGVSERTFTIIPTVQNGTLDGVISPLGVTVRGRTELINTLTAEDITASVDLYGMSGRVTLPVTFGFKGDYSGRVYEIYDPDQPYEVTVTVNESTGQK